MAGEWVQLCRQIELDYLFVINQDNISEYDTIFRKGIDTVQFRNFSKKMNPSLKEYNFSYQAVVDNFITERDK